MQALMPRHFGPFDPAMFSRNAEQILENATADQKARAKLSADLEAEAFRRSLEQARIEVGTIGGPNIKKIIGSPSVHDMTYARKCKHAEKHASCKEGKRSSPSISYRDTVLVVPAEPPSVPVCFLC